MTDVLAVELRDGVLTLTLNRPDKLNSLNADLLLALQEQVAFARETAAVRVLLIAANGRAFGSGADLTTSMSEGRLSAVLDRYYHPLMLALRELEKPVVCAVQGYAAGASCSLALMGDIVLAAESAKFVQIFGRIGLIPDAGSTYVLPRLVGPARALGMMLTTDPVSGSEAAEWGLIWRAVPDEDLLDTAQTLAARLASGPTRAMGIAKRLVRQSFNNDFDTQLQAEGLAQDEAFASADAREGIQAFLQKRDAQFRGQ